MRPIKVIKQARADSYRQARPRFKGLPQNLQKAQDAVVDDIADWNFLYLLSVASLKQRQSNIKMGPKRWMKFTKELEKLKKGIEVLSSVEGRDLQLAAKRIAWSIFLMGVHRHSGSLEFFKPIFEDRKRRLEGAVRGGQKTTEERAKKSEVWHADALKIAKEQRDDRKSDGHYLSCRRIAEKVLELWASRNKSTQEAFPKQPETIERFLKRCEKSGNLQEMEPRSAPRNKKLASK